MNDLYSRFIEMGSGRRSIDADQAEALEFYGVDTDTLPDDVDEDTIDAALDLLREAKTSGSGGYYSYGYDSDEAETLAATAYEALGYDADDAAERARELLADRDC